MSEDIHILELAIGVAALAIALVVYSLNRWWRTKEGWTLFIVILNFTLIKFFALLLVTHTVEPGIASDVVFTLVMVNCLLVLIFMLGTQQMFARWNIWKVKDNEHLDK